LIKRPEGTRNTKFVTAEFCEALKYNDFPQNQQDNLSQEILEDSG